MIEKPATIKSNHNKQMLHDIEQLKGFLIQVERIGKIEWNGDANNDINSNIVIDGGTKMNEKDIIKKKRFKNISKQYNKKENNIHNVQNDKKAKKQEKKLIGLLKKKKTYWRKKMMIYYLSVRDCKKLMEKLNCEIFYHNAKNQKKILEKFVNKKQQMVIATSVFEMKIDVADIKVIMHVNELKTMLDYAQESKWMGWDEKRNEAMVIWGWIKTTEGKGRGEGERENEGEKQMERKKVIKFLETKYWKVALDGYLNKKKNWMDCEEKEEWCQRCKRKKIKKKEIEEEEIKEAIKKKIEKKIEKRIEKKIKKKKK